MDMNIELNMYKLKEDNNTCQKWSEQDYIKIEIDRNMIIVGEGEHFKLYGYHKNNLGELMLDNLSNFVPEQYLERTLYHINKYKYHMNRNVTPKIPKKYLTIDILKNIKDEREIINKKQYNLWIERKE